MYRLQWILFFCLLPLFLSAQNSNLKGYFFPLKKLKKTKVYQFEVSDKPQLTQYWKMKVEEKNGETLLHTHTFNADFRLTEAVVERIDSTGSKLIEFVQFDQVGEADTVDLVENDVFRWYQAAGDRIRWSVLFNNARNETLFFAKERTRLEKCNAPTFKGKSPKSICFKDALHSVNSDTYAEVFAFTQVSYYAERLGLIGFDRSFEEDEGKNANYRLSKVWKEKKWKKLR